MENLLTQLDREMIEAVVKKASGAEKIHKNFYKYWADSKNEKLLKMFGESLIIEKEIEYQQDVRALRTAAREMIEYLAEESEFKYTVEDYLSYSEIIDGVTETKKIFTSTIIIPKGSKISKVIKHLVDPKSFDKTMTKYSQLFNNKKTKGILCLSVHPLDYLTMSVNDCDWSSCLNVFRGPYKEGVVSTMNSSCSIIAYLKSKTDFEVCDGVTWNSKKWRSIVSITEDCVHVNTHYPAMNKGLEREVFDMISEALGQEYLTDIQNKIDFGISTIVNRLYNDGRYKDTNARMFTDKRDFSIVVDGADYCVCCGAKGLPESRISCKNCKTGNKNFDIGTRVRVRTEEEFLGLFGEEWRDAIAYSWNRDGDMDYLHGEEFIITEIQGERVFGLEDRFKDGNSWFISKDMLVCLPPRISDGMDRIMNEFCAGESQYAIQCTTKDLAINFLDYMSRRGETWRNGNELAGNTAHWDDHRDRTVYGRDNRGLHYGDTSYYDDEQPNTIILEWQMIELS